MKTKKFRFIRHILLVFRHKLIVFRYCIRCHLFKAALFHDFSKFSIVELTQSKYFSGKKSPIGIERKIVGYSKASLHHKRNPHHLEYWIEILDTGYSCIRIPYKYIVEMAIDMLAATKIYKEISVLNYIERHQDKYLLFLHPDSYSFLLELFSSFEKLGKKKTLNKKYLKTLYKKHQKFELVIFHDLKCLPIK